MPPFSAYLFVSNPIVTLRATESFCQNGNHRAPRRLRWVETRGTVCAQQSAPRTYFADGRTISYRPTVRKQLLENELESVHHPSRSSSTVMSLAVGCEA